ncbi:MAG: amidohydrolase [Thermoanaerobacterales bacterium]|nr:amidohydrolase [Bacillota bacterium]MDI6906054.1 amidohydrolase [Thermoanaerobacterales bacterium]
MSPLAIINGRVLTMEGTTLDRGTVMVDGERIAAVGPDLPVPPGAEVIDAAGRVVMPGLIDAHCHLGVHEEIFRDEGNDTNESTDPLTPQLRAIDAVNPADLGFTDALSGGVTAACVAPGSANIIGGEMAVLQTAGRVVDEMVLRQPAGLKAALGENPKRVYGTEKKMPRTRMASAALLRAALVQAREYLHKQERAAAGQGEPPAPDLKHEAVARVLRGEIPLRLHAHRADDIATALRIRREFGFSMVIEHATEGWRIADLLAKEGVPVVLGPIITQRAKPEMAGLSLETARIMAEAGVTFAIMTDHPVVPIQYLGLAAMLTVRGGLDEETALRAVTLNAARILGLDDRLGSVAPGKQADLVILSGDPFDVRTRVEKVFICGRVAWEPR